MPSESLHLHLRLHLLLLGCGLAEVLQDLVVFAFAVDSVPLVEDGALAARAAPLGIELCLGLGLLAALAIPDPFGLTQELGPLPELGQKTELAQGVFEGGLELKQY